MEIDILYTFLVESTDNSFDDNEPLLNLMTYIVSEGEKRFKKDKKIYSQNNQSNWWNKKKTFDDKA